jgi:hypothetical protein
MRISLTTTGPTFLSLESIDWVRDGDLFELTIGTYRENEYQRDGEV